MNTTGGLPGVLAAFSNQMIHISHISWLVLLETRRPKRALSEVLDWWGVNRIVWFGELVQDMASWIYIHCCVQNTVVCVCVCFCWQASPQTRHFVEMTPGKWTFPLRSEVTDTEDKLASSKPSHTQTHAHTHAPMLAVSPHTHQLTENGRRRSVDIQSAKKQQQQTSHNLL